MDVSGMVLVILDMQGRLLHLETVPPQNDAVLSQTARADWSSLFAAGGPKESNYRAVQPDWTPLAWGDTRSAWLAAAPANPEIPDPTEQAANHGRPIYSTVIYPLTKAARS